ncbi:endonuclease/exonuclease/phosphatase family protein [Subtercola boreus]|uniref:Endonuclease/exonuclease/phosphatase domain-containing protein n=1 Tax=Subtercola boreus TaxID=120213 RepID=A0A3E0WA73_9MICO|nr:endonuclease/exonuclease/phosphatase family protein [Subtercola boreus]RFA19974.1 hypothetical protein B7R24_10290 [Subtercola boreus]RFA20103.1 hypothetical protein B7R23_10230 [Subtercola boreus]RFA26430.1 hypothetical protein B7R25_10355 [Subtercola boreus]
MLVRIITAMISLAVLAALAVLAWPQALGLEHTLGVAQLVAFRPALAVAAVVVAVLLLFGMLVARRTRAFLGFLAVVLLLFAGGNVAILASRGWTPGAGHAGTTAPAQADAVTVLSWNTLGGQADAQTIADLALRLGADVVTLPETTEATATAVAALLSAGGTPFWSHTVSHGDFPGQSTSILVSSALGEYAVNDSFGDTGNLPSIVASPVNGTGPTLAAVHPVAPVPDDLNDWASDLDWVARLCATPNTIVAGDFNATLDHLTDLADCHDAALSENTAAIGTWPTWLPALIGTPIDHVLATSGWHVVSTEVIQSENEAGSDHRPITATLERQ